MRLKGFFSLLLLAVLAGGGYYFFTGKSNDRVSYALARVERGDIVSTVSTTGTLNPVIIVQVGSQVSGRITELLADFNSEVKKDQVIARIDPATFEARVAEAEADLANSQANVSLQEASVERARAELDNAKKSVDSAQALINKSGASLMSAQRDLNRKRKLAEHEAISQSQLDDARTLTSEAAAQMKASRAEAQAQAATVVSREAQLKMAEAQLIQARAQVRQKEAALRQSRLDLDHTIIRSPVDGIVIERNVDIGQTVAASLQAPILFIIAQDLSEMQVNVSLDEADIGRIREGQRASFTVDAFPGQEFRGEVKQIRKAAQVLSNVVTYTVVLTADNPDQRLLPGMTATVTIIVSERKNVLKVPNAALRFRPESAETDEKTAGDRSGRQTEGKGEERFNRLVEVLKLDETQKVRVREIFGRIRQQAMALREQGASTEEIRSELKNLREKAGQDILPLLTPDQREKYKGLTAARAAEPVTPGRVWIPGPQGKPLAVDITTDITDGGFAGLVRGDLTEGQEVIVGFIQADKNNASAKKRYGF